VTNLEKLKSSLYPAMFCFGLSTIGHQKKERQNSLRKNIVGEEHNFSKGQIKSE
jgi:hypothetical protein